MQVFSLQRTENKTEHWISIILAIGFFCKQFYLFSSGSIQIGDMLLAFGSLVCVAKYGLRVQSIDFPLLIFTICTIVINSIYYITYSEISFLLSSIYFVFNTVLVISAYRNMIGSQSFQDFVVKAFKAAILLQFLIFLSGRGRWYGISSRYMGTFNDPNQYGFYIISAFFCIYIISSALQKKKVHIVWPMIVTVEIIFSASTGMLVCWGFFLVTYIIGLGGDTGFSKKKVIILIAYVVGVITLIISWPFILRLFENSSLFILRRLRYRLEANSGQGKLLEGYLKDRGLRRILIKPEYFLYGSGEGNWIRFAGISGEINELHSTVISLAYCYGVAPYLFFIIWVKNNVRRINLKVLFVYLALLVEAFTLVNHRQPVFWLLISLGSLSEMKRENESITKNADIQYYNSGL